MGVPGTPTLQSAVSYRRIHIDNLRRGNLTTGSSANLRSTPRSSSVEARPCSWISSITQRIPYTFIPRSAASALSLPSPLSHV